MKEEVSGHITGTAVQMAISKAPYLGATVTVVGGLTLNEWLALVGIVFTVLTFVVNFYMQRQRLKLLREEIRGKDQNKRDKDE